MKLENFYLFIVIFILLTSTDLCLGQENDDMNINHRVFVKSTFLSYKNVKDNFGKRFAKSFFVVQVDIRNENENKQYVVQTIDVYIDPLQCRGASEFIRRMNSTTDNKAFSEAECRRVFDENFYVPGEQQPTRSEEVLATGKADLNRSNRNIGFRLLAFTANMGTILTGFNGLIGRDGVLGINVLGTTATAAANALFPNTADAKLENLRNALPGEDIIIKSKESKTINIFIPTERVFWKNSWKEYAKSPRDSNFEAFKLKKILDLILVTSASGVLVDNNAPQVEAVSEDPIRRQTEKVNRISFTEAEIANVDAYFAKLELIEANLANPQTAPATTASLREILTALKADSEINAVLITTEQTKSLTNQSNGQDIYMGIRALSGELGARANGNELQQKFRNIVITKAK